MIWWVLTYLNNDRTWTDLITLAETNHPAHLIMAWSKHEPARRPIYRIIRGKRVFCGYKYVWDTPNLTEQVQHLDTFEHLFKLQGLDPLDHIWYVLSSTRKLYERYCQGPLIHVPPMPADQPCYYVYFASRLKGIYRTLTFSGPGTLQPYWSPDNEGLLSLSIRQAVVDPFDRYRRRYLIAGGDLYLHYNAIPFQPAISTTILTWSQAIALTGSVDGSILWVDPNIRHPGMLHVLWSGTPAPCSFWHLRTLDYGQHWTAHLIQAETGSSSAGNIIAGRDQGTSPYPEGHVVYAVFNLGLFDTPALGRSIDQGATWATLDAPDIGRGAFRPRIWVDPSNQTVVYIGCHPSYPKLYRSQDHGNSWTRVDQGKHICPNLNHSGHHQSIGTHLANPNLVRAFVRFLVHTSQDYCASWQTTENVSEPLPAAKFTNDNPNLLYLAKIFSGTPPPAYHGPHVIFVSDDEGATFHPKAGANAHLSDGGGDSIPYNCGGASDDGILPII